MKLYRWFLTFSLMVSFLAASFGREVPVYRCQIGAYNTRTEAETQLERFQEFENISIENVPGPYPYKVRIGYFGAYDKGKGQVIRFKNDTGENAFLVCEYKKKEDAASLGVDIPPTYEQELRERTQLERVLAEPELRNIAEKRVSKAKEISDEATRKHEMLLASPYLLQLVDEYPESASRSWAHHYLGTYFLMEYNHELRVRRERIRTAVRAGKKEEACINAALEHFEISAQDMSSPFAEEDAYQVASMTAALRKSGIERDNINRGIQAYEDFMRNNPESAFTDRAEMNILGLKFEQAKSNRIPMQEVLAQMERAAYGPRQLKEFERGRVLLMMGEIHCYYTKDYEKALDVLTRVNVGPEQDRITSSTTIYLISEAYRGLGRYNEASAALDAVLNEYSDDETFLGFPLHSSCLWSLGECRMEVGDWYGAKQAFERLKTEWPRSWQAPKCDEFIERAEREGGLR